MYELAQLSGVEKQCILRFLYRIATSDFKIVEEEVCVINNIGLQFGIEIGCSEVWLKSDWNADDEKMLNEIITKSDDLSGQIISWAMEVMNADKLKHQNEQVAILQLLQESIGNPKYQKATMVPIEGFDSTMIKMLKVTPEICLKKAEWWQKKKNNKPLKRVGASISYQANGKKKFVTAVNYELSMPGGSRCAEQNAIGMAVAREPELEFQAIKEVVVYGAGGLCNPCWPCGVCMENLRKLDKENQIEVYCYPSDYVYKHNALPKAMFRLSLSSLTQRSKDI